MLVFYKIDFAVCQGCLIEFLLLIHVFFEKLELQGLRLA